MPAVVAHTATITLTATPAITLAFILLGSGGMEFEGVMVGLEELDVVEELILGAERQSAVSRSLKSDYWGKKRTTVSICKMCSLQKRRDLWCQIFQICSLMPSVT